jgi:hypothetical protein
MVRRTSTRSASAAAKNSLHVPGDRVRGYDDRCVKRMDIFPQDLWHDHKRRNVTPGKSLDRCRGYAHPSPRKNTTSR